MPRYGRRDARFCGSAPGPWVHGMRHGTVPRSIAARTASAAILYASTRSRLGVCFLSVPRVAAVASGDIGSLYLSV
ncbi:unannotated protein [freshwater metagenome]|uniref:Unannotated protein n=1 Tax=freshwater metagenome TaxID=449393 RepID=A0A6J7I5J9_9ZZZZ